MCVYKVSNGCSRSGQNIFGVLVVSTSTHMALAANDIVTKVINNKGVNVHTDTDQKSSCETAGGTSSISSVSISIPTPCSASSSNTIAENGGVVHGK